MRLTTNPQTCGEIEAMCEPDVFFTTSPDRVIAEMLRLGEVHSDSLVYDLGCGDGRILIAAAREKGARGVGIDIDPERIAECRANAVHARVEDRLSFARQNFFEVSISEATVIILYLLDSLNVRLRPRILAECAPGARVVSYSFEMGEWAPDAHTPMAANGVFLWIVPANLAGVWMPASGIPTGALESISLRQTFQKLSGFVLVGGIPAKIIEGVVKGSDFTLTAKLESHGGKLTISGRERNGVLEGTMQVEGVATPLVLRRTNR